MSPGSLARSGSRPEDTIESHYQVYCMATLDRKPRDRKPASVLIAEPAHKPTWRGEPAWFTAAGWEADSSRRCAAAAARQLAKKLRSRAVPYGCAQRMVVRS